LNKTFIVYIYIAGGMACN